MEILHEREGQIDRRGIEKDVADGDGDAQGDAGLRGGGLEC
jgi:hypothetical protein